MKTFVSMLLLTWSLAAGPTLAQAYPPNEVGVTMGHWHLNSQQVEANKKLFVALGGTAIKPGDFEIVRFPGVAVFLHQGPGTPPPTGGTEGTVINHVGFIVPNVAESVIPEMQAWYAKHFGAKPGKRGRNQAADVPGANLTFTKSDKPTIPTRGRHLDHVGFDVKDLVAFAKKLEAAGVPLERQIVARPDGSKLAFIKDPWGTRIELNERSKPL